MIRFSRSELVNDNQNMPVILALFYFCKQVNRPKKKKRKEKHSNTVYQKSSWTADWARHRSPVLGHGRALLSGCSLLVL